MKCWICHTQMIKITQDEEWSGWGNPPVIIPQVTSWICPNTECKDQVYDSLEATRIQNAMRRIGVD